MGRIAVLVSGSGTILEALLEDRLPVVVVAADRPCRALEVARSSGVATELVVREHFGPGFDRVAYSERLLAALRPYEVDLVAMAGFMTVLAEPFLAAWPGRVLNTHPSLLPAFRGAHAVEAALAAGVKVTGCTVHVAAAEVDAGPILAQEPVRVLASDTVETLHERIKAVERRLYPATIRAELARLAAGGGEAPSDGAQDRGRAGSGAPARPAPGSEPAALGAGERSGSGRARVG